MIFIAASMLVRSERLNVPIRFMSRSVLIARNCSQVAIVSIVNPDVPALKRTWLGYTLDLFEASVHGTTIITGLLLLIASRLTTITGRIPACSDPRFGLRLAR